MERAKNAGWYDMLFRDSPVYGGRYEDSPYYEIWSRIVREIGAITSELGRPARILEIGCGTGQLARMLQDRGYTRYLGVDFSRQGLDLAIANAPLQTFALADLCLPWPVRYAYDVVIATEVLEHLADDLSCVERIRSGARVLVSVPDFMGSGHVRCFKSAEAVRDRYDRFIEWQAVEQVDSRRFMGVGVRR